jgi:eukaryotic-like serine/threonine-protein kinase
MALSAGTRFGPYEVIDLLGAGGMGEVYRAHDARLNRDVALKILPDVFSADPERRARFEREAQVLASLNHSHIAQIYGLEESRDVRAIVMELVPGEPLSDRIARGPIPLDEALPIARQIADALEAAHDLGIIHRDLKPDNVTVRPDGMVKVLDFGLAKLVQGSGSGPQTSRAGDLTASPTMASPVLATGVGVLLGTAAYMSPEQARGRDADPNTLQIMAASYTIAGGTLRADKPRPWSPGRSLARPRLRPYALHPDGNRVAVVWQDEAQPTARQDRVVFVFNFFDELRRLAPPSK